MPAPEQRTYNNRRKKFATDFKDTQDMAVQSHKDNCDINRVLDRAKTGQAAGHLMKYQGVYGDFSDFDENTYETMVTRLAAAHTIFNDLPAEIRQEFGNNPGVFFQKVNDPRFKDRLEELFPVLQRDGRQFPDVLGQGIQQAIATGFETVATASTKNAPPKGATETTNPENTDTPKGKPES